MQASKLGFAGLAIPLFLLASCKQDAAVDANQSPAHIPLPRLDSSWNTALAYDSVDYAGQSYRTVQLGSAVWMAQNLNYSGPAGNLGVCYQASADSCAKYGKLYTWFEVMAGSPSSVAKPSGVRGICPLGWHVPSQGEWPTGSWDGDPGVLGEALPLMSKLGWKDPLAISFTNGGTDSTGFRALPGGWRDTTGGFSEASLSANFWSATQSSETLARSNGFGISGRIARERSDKRLAFSLRCVKD